MNIFIKYMHFLPSLILASSIAHHALFVSWSDPINIMEYKYSFMITALVAIFSIAIQLYNNLILDRLFVAFNSYYIFLSGIVAFQLDISHFNYTHNTFLLLFLVFLVGMITTVFTKAGFIGVETKDPRIIRGYSYTLLILFIVMNIISCIIHYFFISLSPVTLMMVPLLVLINSRENMMRRLEKTK